MTYRNCDVVFVSFFEQCMKITWKICVLIGLRWYRDKLHWVIRNSVKIVRDSIHCIDSFCYLSLKQSFSFFPLSFLLHLFFSFLYIFYSFLILSGILSLYLIYISLTCLSNTVKLKTPCSIRIELAALINSWKCEECMQSMQCRCLLEKRTKMPFQCANKK